MLLRIMLVDDEPHCLKAIQTLLQPLGCSVLALTNSWEAARRLHTEKFDGLFLDTQMPGIDGFELTRRVRLSPVNARIPIVMLAPENDAETMRAGFQAGASLLTGKSLDRRQIGVLFNLLAGNAGVDKRRHTRVRFRTPVHCRWDERFVEIHSVNIGESGMLLEPAGGLEADQEVVLEFHLPALIRPLTVKAVVEREEPPNRIAVRFTAVTEEDREIIGYLVESLEYNRRSKAA